MTGPSRYPPPPPPPREIDSTPTPALWSRATIQWTVRHFEAVGLIYSGSFTAAALP